MTETEKRRAAAMPVGDAVAGEQDGFAASLSRRQSAPQSGAAQYLQEMGEKGVTGAEEGIIKNGFDVLQAEGERPPIGREEIALALATLKKYKTGKANLERKVIENEQWYKLRHWECLRDKSREGKEKAEQITPTSAWLFNCLANKHADAMDYYPSPNILPRAEDDKSEAQMLSAILPVVLEMCDYESVWSQVNHYKNKTGTGVTGVFWEKSKLYGMGDIDIRKTDLLALFWEPGITDIQKSRNLFHVELCDDEVLHEKYPETAGKVTGRSVDVAQYYYDDTVDTTGKSEVVDWYYKKYIGGREVLHYCKFVGETLIYASENDPACATRGWYDHGKYPFVFDVLFPLEGTPAGFGYIDIGKDAQEYIDRGNRAIMKNMLANAAPRHFIRSDGGVNEEEYADLTRDFVHVDRGLGQDSILPIVGKTLPNVYLNVLTNKIDELKETTGNRDISTGGTTSGVTAASAIAAMQEAGSKLSRDQNKSAWRAFREICYLVIELIRQFYDMPRTFRITGEDGREQFVSYSNQNIKAQDMGSAFGVRFGARLPMFDIEVSAQKQSPYSKMSQNELALQFYNAGFFDPTRTDQALACLDMMDFDRKSFVMNQIRQNGTMFDQLQAVQGQLLQLAQVVDAMKGSNYTQQFAAQFASPDGAPLGSTPVAALTQALGGESGGESKSVTAARARVAEAASPV